MISPINSPQAAQESSSPIAMVGDLAGRVATIKNEEQVSFPPIPEKADLRDLLMEGVNDALRALEEKQQAFQLVNNKAFATVIAQRILFWQEVQQQVADQTNPCGIEQLQILYHLVQEDNILLETATETSIPQFILSNLSKLYVNDLTKKAILLEQLVGSNENLQELLEPHLRTMLEQVKENDLKGIARCWKEMLETLLPQAESFDERMQNELKILSVDLQMLQKLFSLEKFDIDIFALIYTRNYIRDAQILLNTLKEDAEERKALLQVLAQMQIYLQQGNPLGIAMLWNNLLENQAEALLGQEREEEALHAIQFVCRNAAPLKKMLSLVIPGLITEEFSEEEIKSLIEIISMELLAIAEDISVHHPEFTKNLGQWLGLYSADNRHYAALVSEGKRGMIQHPTKIAVWVKDLSALMKKGLQSVPEKYSKILEEAERVATLISSKRH